MVHVYTCSSYSEFLISMDTTDLASTSVSKGICESVLEITNNTYFTPQIFEY